MWLYVAICGIRAAYLRHKLKNPGRFQRVRMPSNPHKYAVSKVQESRIIV